jgi:trigger factor
LISDSYTQALEEANLEPVAQPDFDFDPPQGGKDFIYKLTLDVKPEFELEPDSYKKLELKEPKLEVTDEQIGERIEALRDQQAVLVPMEEERPAATGDVVIVNYQSMLDGEPVEGGEADNVEVELGRGQVQEEIEVALLKTRPGEMVETKVTYDDSAANPQVRGKEVVFKLLVKEIKTKALPDLDDDFARSVNPQFENLQALEERLRQELSKAYEEQKESVLRRQILEKVADLGDFELPGSLVDSEVRQMVASFKNRMEQSGGTLEQAGMNEAALAEQFKGTAEQKVRTGIVLARIADLEKVEVSDADLEAEYAKISERLGQPVESIKQIYIKNNMIESLRAQVMEENTLQAIKADAIIKKVDPAQLAKEIEEKGQEDRKE